jgi:hypothetical protein
VEIDVKGFKPQNFPMTDNKVDSFAKRLESHENFIKHNYVLQKLGIKCSVQELHDEYTDFCKKEQRSALKKIEFGARLKELGIEYYKSNGNNKYKVSIEFLQELATTRHWIHDIDDYKSDKKAPPTSNGLDDEIPCTELTDDDLIRRLKDKEEEVNDLNEQFEKMRLEFEAYKMQFPSEKISRTPFVRVIDESDDETDQLPAPIKSVLQMIDDSDSDGEEESKTVILKDNKIMTALGCDLSDCDFLE